MFFVKLGLTKTPSRKRGLSKLIHKIEGIFRAGGVEASGIRVDVKGDGGSKIFASVDRMAVLTGMPAALGGILLATRRFEAGVYPPEAVIEPREFIRELATKGLKVLEYVEDEWRELSV